MIDSTPRHAHHRSDGVRRPRAQGSGPLRSRVHASGSGFAVLDPSLQIDLGGGAGNIPGAGGTPLGAPTVSGTKITVDTMLNQPQRITRMVMDMTLQRFVADRIFSSGGGVTGGAVVYDSVEANDLYTDRDVERVSPGGEFPIVTSSRRAPGRIVGGGSGDGAARSVDLGRGQGPQRRRPGCSPISCVSSPTRSCARSTCARSRRWRRCSRRTRCASSLQVPGRGRVGCRHADGTHDRAGWVAGR